MLQLKAIKTDNRFMVSNIPFAKKIHQLSFRDICRVQLFYCLIKFISIATKSAQGHTIQAETSCVTCAKPMRNFYQRWGRGEHRKD